MIIVQNYLYSYRSWCEPVPITFSQWTKFLQSQLAVSSVNTIEFEFADQTFLTKGVRMSVTYSNMVKEKDFYFWTPGHVKKEQNYV